MTLTSKLGREVGLVLLLATIVFTPVLLAGQGSASRGPAGFPDLVGALKDTPGCIGVETAMTQTGKRVIFAWFENKKAVLNWYYSDVHQATMKQFFPTATGRTPLADVPDDVPVLAIASLTMADGPQGGVMSTPFSQIAIELYTTLPGGLSLGGRFAPAALKVPGLREADVKK